MESGRADTPGWQWSERGMVTMTRHRAWRCVVGPAMFWDVSMCLYFAQFAMQRGHNTPSVAAWPEQSGGCCQGCVMVALPVSGSPSETDVPTGC